MGLGGRKIKQRIGNDPRNLSWADDAARFGQNYLSKFGWDASKGLGAEGEGRTSALKVAQKLDMLGIGAAHQKDPNGIAWKQNKDFENLLRRLNAANGDEEGEVKTNVSGFSRAVESNIEGATKSMTVVEVKEEVMMDIGEGEKNKRNKKSKKDKEGKRKRSEEEDGEKDSKKLKTVEEWPTPPVEAEAAAPPKRSFVPRHRAHRARAIAAKSISSKSSVHISEILGIAPDNSVFLSLNSAPTLDQGKLTVINSENEPTLEKLTTSTKSVADYFKEKLAAKAAGGSASSSGLGPSRDEEEEEEDRPRGGLGMGFARVSWESSQQQVKTEMADGESLPVGLSKFSSLMSSTFLTGVMEPEPSSSPTPQIEQAQDSEGESSEDEKSKRRERKRLKKEEKANRRIEKEKRRAAKAAAVTSDGEDASETKKSREKKRKIQEVIGSVPEGEGKEKKKSKDKRRKLDELAEVGTSKKKKSKKDSNS